MACPFGPETTAHAEHAALDECIPYATEHLFRSAEVVVSSDHDDPPSHPVERISDVDAAHVNTGGDSKDVLLLGPFGHGVANDSVSGGSDPVVTSLIDVPCPLGRYRARETVVSSVKSESVSADRRSITRQNRSTARSARRRFSSSADGVGETVLLGAGDEMGRDAWLGIRFGAAGQESSNAPCQNACGEPGEPSLHRTPPISPSST